jgi:hypothetical protein
MYQLIPQNLPLNAVYFRNFRNALRLRSPFTLERINLLKAEKWPIAQQQYILSKPGTELRFVFLDSDLLGIIFRFNVYLKVEQFADRNGAFFYEINALTFVPFSVNMVSE